MKKYILCALFFLFVDSAHAGFVKVTHIYLRNGQSPMNIQLGNVIDTAALYALTGKPACPGCSAIKSVQITPTQVRIQTKRNNAWFMHSPVSSCPEGQEPNSKGICETPPPTFCESKAAEIEEARLACNGDGDEFVSQCDDDDPSSFSMSCSNYCDSQDAKNMRDSLYFQCGSSANGAPFEFTSSCIASERRVEGNCVIENNGDGDGNGDNGGDTGGGDSGGDDTGGGDSGGGDNGDNSGGDDGSGGDTGGGDSGSGNTGGGDSGGDNGSGNNGGGTGGSTGGNTPDPVEPVEIDLTGVINGIKNFNTDNNKGLTDIENTLELQFDLAQKYHETLKSSKDSIDHMSKFTEDELALLSDMSGQFLTHFDETYKKNDLLITSNDDIKKGVEDINTSFIDSYKQQAELLEIGKIDSFNIESIDGELKINNEKTDELITTNKKGFAEILAAIENISMASPTLSMAAPIVNVEAPDLSGIENELDSIGQQLTKIANVDVSSAGDEACYNTASGCPSYWESRYPDGLSTVMSGYMSRLQSGSVGGAIDTFTQIDLTNAQEPEFNICIDVGLYNFGCYNIFGDFMYVWAFVRFCIMYYAVIYSRKIIFGM